jgi:hypothetical protein
LGDSCELFIVDISKMYSNLFFFKKILAHRTK